MSKRYGRNQKRRHVEEIKALKKKLEISDKIYSDVITITQAKLTRASHSIEKMVSMIENICEYSSVLPAKMITGNLTQNTFRLPVKSQKHILHRTWSESIVNLHALNIYIEEHYDTFSKCVHMEYDGNYSYYLISKEALFTTPTEELSKCIIPKIVKELIHHLKEGLRR